jgi:hypothetical protein
MPKPGHNRALPQNDGVKTKLSLPLLPPFGVAEPYPKQIKNRRDNSTLDHPTLKSKTNANFLKSLPHYQVHNLALEPSLKKLITNEMTQGL